MIKQSVVIEGEVEVNSLLYSIYNQKNIIKLFELMLKKNIFVYMYEHMNSNLVHYKRPRVLICLKSSFR